MSMDESIDDKLQSQNADIVLNILRDYLGITDNSKRITTLLGSKTSRPDDTESPSSQRPNKYKQNIPEGYYSCSSFTSIPSNIGNTKTSSSSSSLSTTFYKTTSNNLKQQEQRAKETQTQISELLERLRSYNQSMPRPLIPPESISTDILNDKVLLKRIYTELKKQQLHRILGKHPMQSSSNLPYSLSFSNLWNYQRDISSDDIKTKQQKPLINNERNYGVTNNNTSKKNNIEHGSSSMIPLILIKNPSCEKIMKTIGSQTDFIQLNELKILAKEYEDKKKEEEQNRVTTDDEIDKGYSSSSRRKSSIDNEDVSQSVSNTIKRYLRMARKKSVHDDHANRFKRVNYDRNLRNIHAKGEINPPGMDEDNNKATQTLDSWPLLYFDHIRGIDNPKLLEDSHIDWQINLQQRIKLKQEYDEQQQKKNQQSDDKDKTYKFTSTSTPHHSSANKQQNVTDTMQKSKSSSNVGQFVSKKIWRSRSRSQTRAASPIKSEWSPQGNCIWTTAKGKRLILKGSKLHDLTEIERKILHRVAIEKINQLNIGISVTVPNEDSTSNTETTTKKRRPLLIKRKALTTSFFDTAKKTEDKGGGSGLVFGVSLEKCVNNDNRKTTSTATTTGSDRGSRNSIGSLLGSNSSNNTGRENIGSSETLSLNSNTTVRTSIISSSKQHQLSDNITNKSSVSGGGIGQSNQISCSQTDVHNLSQDEDESLNLIPPMVESIQNSGQQVPALVTACINHLEQSGMHTVGLFRVSTSIRRVRQLREDFDSGKITTLDPDISPHDVATILKEYLRDLPEPLLCQNLYNAFIKTQKIRNRRLQLEALSHLIQLLPVAHRDTLYVLLKFLAKIVRNSDDITSRDGTVLAIGNKMDSYNLAAIFAPNILRSSSSSLPSSSGRNTSEFYETLKSDVVGVIRSMIDHYEELFKVSAELMDEIYTNMMDSHPQQLNYLCEKRELYEKYVDNSSCISTNPPLNSQLQPSNSLIPVVESGSGSASEQNSRRIYSREDFLHENAVKCETNGSLLRNRRERSSKSRNQDNDFDASPSTSSRRHRRDRYHHDKQQQSEQQKNLQDHNQYQQRNSEQIKSLSRRLSSPQVLQNSGIVTASLKIPVQVHNENQQEQQQQSNKYYQNIYREQLDLQDIPFIEDEGATCLNYNRPEQIKSSRSNNNDLITSFSDLFLKDDQSSGSGGGGVVGDKVVIPISTTRKHSANEINPMKINTISAFVDNQNNQKINLHQHYQQQQLPSSSSSLLQQKQYAHHTEPKITPSITNIGGDVLRSKTADFERMSKIKNNNSRSGIVGDNFVTTSISGPILSSASSGSVPSSLSLSSGIATASASASVTTPINENENDKTQRSSHGPVYKRQELISSAVKPKPSK